MQRGVAGDPAPWMAATGIGPRPARAAIAALPSTVQERWFARLYLLKGLALGGLALFWIVSGAIALAFAFEAGTAILVDAGLPPSLAPAMTVATSLLDIGIGLSIAFRKTARVGLVAGIGIALGYMLAAAALTPALWGDPVGGLVKTGPAILLMLLTLAMLEER